MVSNWKAIVLFWLICLTAICAFSAATRLWVLTAVPVGFLFEVVLCGLRDCGHFATAFSSWLRTVRR